MHDPDDRNEALAREVGRELRKPVTLSPDLEQRVMAQIRREARRSRLRPLLTWGGLAVAAGLAALVFGIGTRTEMHGEPGAQRVAFRLEAPSASRVTLVGDFNNWDPSATPLTRSPQGRWEAIVPLEPGRYQFTYMVDGSHWVADPRLPAAAGDDFGEPTSVITIIPSARL